MMARPCDMLPPVRGTYTYDAPLKDLVWFRAGGTAEWLFRPADVEDLATFLAARPDDLRLAVIGVGSNLLVRDGGIPGVVVRLSSAFGRIRRPFHIPFCACRMPSLSASAVFQLKPLAPGEMPSGPAGH